MADRLTPLDLYVAGFVVRGGGAIDAPGLHGLVPTREAPRVRLLVTDDRAHDVLAAALPLARAGMVSVLAGAPRCAALAGAALGWESKRLTAVVHGARDACLDATASGLPIYRRLGVEVVAELTQFFRTA